MWQYTEKVMDHFTHPRNCGSLPDADGIGQVGNLVCGDSMKLYIKMAEDKKTIADAKFQTFGCASAIASASALTCMIIGKPLEYAVGLSNQDIVDFLGGLPDEKEHCSVMGFEALEAAVADMAKRHPEIPQPKPPQAPDNSRVVCKCFNVTENKIRNIIKEHHLKTVEEVTNYTKAGGGCGRCKADIQAILDEINAVPHDAPAPEPKPGKLTNLQKINLIMSVFNEEITPALKGDGGDAELVDVDGNDVYVKLLGACAHCAAAEMTMRNWVEAKLREKVSPELHVVDVTKR
ncbi:MAG: Fe-S cluster assembly protein NifU [Victivallales bacterium]|nr:Fe-S cluster assembly protein NifU [Victivallales bacterium]